MNDAEKRAFRAAFEQYDKHRLAAARWEEIIKELGKKYAKRSGIYGTPRIERLRQLAGE